MNGGRGITAHRLAAILRRFGVKPKQQRIRDGVKIRGYWLADFKDSFNRYLFSCPVGGSESGQTGQCNDNNGLDDFRIGTEPPPSNSNRDKNNKSKSLGSEVRPVCLDSKGGMEGKKDGEEETGQWDLL